MKKRLTGLMVTLLLLAWVTPASALIISIDLDPGTAGIQSTLGVTAGSSFTIDVVLTGDGVQFFDAFAFAVDFNDLGAVLGLAPPIGPFAAGLPTAGTIAASAPILVLDAFAFAFVFPGNPLTPSGMPFPLTAGFTGSSDGVGILSLGGPFFKIPAGTTIDLFSVTFDALAAGTSTVVLSTGALGGLTLFGSSVPFSFAAGTVTVTDATAVPEPSTLGLLGAGLLGLLIRRRRTA